ncbi:response regulator [Streptomyces sp. NPDC093589]|uniref:response regulator transcription factor n=1 Tax=Streptomyces sp. NPDC093589 TaxID=3366043 RepID=UPI00381F0962
MPGDGIPPRPGKALPLAAGQKEGAGVKEPERVTVIVADDHPVYREGIARALRASERLRVLAETEDGPATIDAIAAQAPDVAVVDYRLPGADGIAVVRALARDGSPTRILLLSAITDSAVVYRALQEGAAGYLSKEAERAEIVAAVLDVAGGGTVLPPALMGDLAGEIRARAADERTVLSERERQVLVAFARGSSVPQIAEELYLSTSTVKSHVQRLYEKLEVSDRAAAVAVAMRRGLLE